MAIWVSLFKTQPPKIKTWWFPYWFPFDPPHKKRNRNKTTCEGFPLGFPLKPPKTIRHLPETKKKQIKQETREPPPPFCRRRFVSCKAGAWASWSRWAAMTALSASDQRGGVASISWGLKMDPLLAIGAMGNEKWNEPRLWSP